MRRELHADGLTTWLRPTSCYKLLFGSDKLLLSLRASLDTDEYSMIVGFCARPKRSKCPLPKFKDIQREAPVAAPCQRLI